MFCTSPYRTPGTMKVWENEQKMGNFHIKQNKSIIKMQLYTVYIPLKPELIMLMLKTITQITGHGQQHHWGLMWPMGQVKQHKQPCGYNPSLKRSVFTNFIAFCSFHKLNIAFWEKMVHLGMISLQTDLFLMA